MKKTLILALALSVSLPSLLSAQSLKLNELEYFEDRGVNFLVYSNDYNGMFCDEKTAAIEIIQRGVRIATGGGIRLMNTPEQWDIYPVLEKRNVDKAGQSIEVVLNYADYNFKPSIKVTPKDKGVVLAVYLDQPVPENLEGKAGLNLEFFPAAYFGKTFLMDGKPDIFPKHPAGETSMHPNSEKITQIYGLSTFNERGRDEFIVPAPISTGHTLVLAPEDDDLRVTFKSDTEINLFDGRNLSPNGTFVVRSFLPSGKIGKVAEWYVEMAFDPEWVRKPNIGFSQVGYTPAQKKVAVVEVDKNYVLPAKARIIRINPDGSRSVALEPAVKEWGVYNNRYNYATVDFSAVKNAGVYCIEFGEETTNVFPIADNVYGDKWHTTMDVWLPAQMDHMEVKEAYRIWHGRSNMDDAVQAPLNYSQQDGYTQGPVSYTKYKDFEHIPGLTVGAWYDAGDFDIQSGTVIGLTQQFAFLWDLFHEDRDQTYIDQKTQFVDIHRPDGKPDVLQQCEHGLLNIIAQVENIGFVAQGIVQGNMWQYAHIGDGVTQTDGFVYNPSLQPYDIVRGTSGTRDDRHAFTSNYSPAGQMSTIAALAAGARALKEYDPELSEHALKLALKLWEENRDAAAPDYISSGAYKNIPDEKKSYANKVWEEVQLSGTNVNNRRRNMGDTRFTAAVQLWRATGEDQYKEFFMPFIMAQLNPQTINGMGAMNGRGSNLSTALELYPYMDKEFQKAVKAAVPAYVKGVEAAAKENPYGVPVQGRGWGGTEIALGWAYNNYMVWKYFPDMIDPELVLNGMHFIFGRHPYSNVSFVTSVGVNTKKVAYGNNRGDYTVIPGGIAPGLLLMNPDFMEHKDDYPFHWGENECCTRNVPQYMMLTLGAEEITNYLNKKKSPIQVNSATRV